MKYLKNTIAVCMISAVLLFSSFPILATSSLEKCNNQLTKCLGKSHSTVGDTACATAYAACLIDRFIHAIEG